jgi:hypothetical protein
LRITGSPDTTAVVEWFSENCEARPATEQAAKNMSTP